MPGPPPPPPMGPVAPPPPPPFSLPKGGGGGGADNRGALLKSIRQGAKLKKTVTVDKSGPYIPGNQNSTTNSSSSSSSLGGNGPSSGGSTNPAASIPNGPPIGLGGLFANGMPKLRPTGKLGASKNNNVNGGSNATPRPQQQTNNVAKMPKSPAPSKNFISIQNELKKQMASPSDNRSRGPPPPAPMRHISVEEPASNLKSSHNGFSGSQASIPISSNNSSLHANASTLHRVVKSKSNANLSTLDAVDATSNGQMNKPVINHGKPNLAPKPPLNGKPTPPSKLKVNTSQLARAQSMRSPTIQSPKDMPQFGTVRSLASVMHNGSNPQTPRRPLLNGRPTVPPPSVPPPNAIQATPKVVKPPNHAPPPPPGCPGNPLPQPPSHAPPPPPPHKTAPPTRPPPAVPAENSNIANPPPPPPRHSSMREAPSRIIIDLEERFRDHFVHPSNFPSPPPYKNVMKFYTNKQANKQPAPLPPAPGAPPQLPTRNWNPTSTC